MRTNDLILNYYNGEDAYSDGDVEGEILDIINQKIDIDSLLKKDTRWEILYHLSPQRRNILEWMDFSNVSNVLEVGAGCGALTELLCEKAQKVTAVELSKRRASIIQKRCMGFDNLDILVGNVLDVPFTEKGYDLVTLIGVLEYSGHFVDHEEPYLHLLEKLGGVLSSNGELIIAIENKFGIKYWAGAREDHTSIFFDSLEGYPKTKSVRTFGYKEINELISRSGLSVKNFMYPVPDYKLPNQIFSDSFIPSSGFLGELNHFIDNDGISLFDENLVLDGIITNENFPFFANSFLIVCGRK
ncbi:SAM-dependent methyltransferase [Paenibacillus sp. JGP012]|uniref:class I SAM-dependent methyltransferase n=1 Tax=Paenibacillus sp. JGP012 TaxID=2735914 RepID=UPI0016182E05|nr:methyltransferase domain-containing protein [Paenibacillus sp. JGP012]MBB6024668.1 SAM-dependent methyltransferase [Paenibacillus sp. JGP012]